MKVIIAMDSFKGSISSLQAGEAVKRAVLRTDPAATVEILPLADGGEGTTAAIYSALGGEMINITVTGPLGEPVKAGYCVLPDKKTAVIEMAAAAGLTLVPAEKRDPVYTTTRGVGEMIADAIKRGCRDFFIGIGGSATNDGGTGMLSALGFDFSDGAGRPIKLCAQGLEELESISAENALPELKNCNFRVACDVNNPLCGENGCSAVFGPQKGAKPEDIPLMDGWLKSYAEKAKAVCENADPDHPGAGAAGGMGFAFLSFLSASLQSGVDIVLDVTGFEEKVKTADIVVTGEGRLDEQTAMGKAPVGVARIAKKYGKRVIAFSGCVTEYAEVCNNSGIDAFFPIVRGVCTLEEALNVENAQKNLEAAAYQVFRLLAT